jgi:SAM-dependent methyltransferase
VTDRLRHWFRRLVLHDHLHFVERALNESESPGMVLDVGCGDGLFLEMLAERGRTNIAGLDFSPDAATAAWTRAGVPAICGTLSPAPFAPGSCALTMFQIAGTPIPSVNCWMPPASCWHPRAISRTVPNVASGNSCVGEHWNGVTFLAPCLTSGGGPQALLEMRLECCGASGTAAQLVRRDGQQPRAAARSHGRVCGMPPKQPARGC